MSKKVHSEIEKGGATGAIAFIKLVFRYWITIHNKNFKKFPVSSIILILFQLLIGGALCFGYWKAFLKPIFIPYEAVVLKVNPEVTYSPGNRRYTTYKLQLQKVSTDPSNLPFELSVNKELFDKLHPGDMVEKPKFYSFIIPKGEKRKISVLLRDILFIICFGTFLFILAFSSVLSFFTVLYASLFMVESPYEKEKSGKKEKKEKKRKKKK